MIETIEFKGQVYPKFQSEGNAAQFAIPFAKHVCKGKGLDIGFCKEEWKFPDAIGIDLVLNDGYHADSLPEGEWDYIFSSHLLEHVPNWSCTLEYWFSKLKPGGVLFLYLPDCNLQSYWRPWHNKKHIHYLNPAILGEYMKDCGLSSKYLVDGTDANYSFTVIAEKI